MKVNLAIEMPKEKWSILLSFSLCVSSSSFLIRVRAGKRFLSFSCVPVWFFLTLALILVFTSIFISVMCLRVCVCVWFLCYFILIFIWFLVFSDSICAMPYTLSVHTLFSVIYKTVLEFIALLFLIHNTCRILFSESSLVVGFCFACGTREQRRQRSTMSTQCKETQTHNNNNNKTQEQKQLKKIVISRMSA